MKVFFILLITCVGTSPVFSTDNPDALAGQNTLLTQNKPFSRQMMQLPGYSPEVSGFSLLDPSRFSMSQSYSTSMSYSQAGTYSYGLYLNTLSYRLFNPLTFSIDLGIYTPFYSSSKIPTSSTGSSVQNLGSFVLPRIGLEYKPSKNTLISVQYYNLNDAYKAYGPFGHFGSPFIRR